jgi:outer membrane protein assembly factor BamB
MTEPAVTNSLSRDQRRAATWRFAALSLAVTAAVFSTAVGGLMVWVHVNDADNVWTNAAPMAALENQLEQQPTDAALKEKIRQVDRASRAEFFRRQEELQTGGWLLLAGLAISLAAAKGYAALRPATVEAPTEAALTRGEWAARARRNSWSVAVGGAALAIGLGGVVILGHGGLPGAPQAAVVPAAVAVLPVGETWPMFRGPTGMGIAPPGDWPQSWNTESGENILWKCVIPGEGNSSPCVWGSRIFLTSADENHRWLHCVDAGAGMVLWSSEVKSPPGAPSPDSFKPLDDTGYAAPTAATDGARVYVTYANADVAAFDFAGKQLWVRNLGLPQSTYGLASSPVIYNNWMILQHDQGAEANERLSSIMALDGPSGRIVWQTPRPAPASWSTPILVRPDPASERVELIACGEPWVIAYDPATGRELWRVKGLDGDVAPSPVAAGGVVFTGVTNSDATKARLLAIRAGGSGDVTTTRVLWTAGENLPDMVSPVADGERCLVIGENSVATCYNSHDGKVLWTHDFATQCKPSPVLAGDVVYLPVADGRTFVFRQADKFELLHTCKLDEATASSPAFAGGRVYIRGATSLYCIGSRTEGKK